MKPKRRLPVGAELQGGEGVHFRVWAPARQRVEVVTEGSPLLTAALSPEGDGFFAGSLPGARAGTLYRYRLEGGDAFPDPASRFQPQGPHGPSQVIDPSGFQWTDAGWRGCEAQGQVVYEMHVGTFTPGGTWEAAARQLPELAALGITVVEVMPVAEFPGNFGWGYDGVSLFAPTRLYGTPDDFRRFVDRAHACGLGVILDVVYNHFGPDGNYLRQFGPHFFTDRYENEWGDPINFDGPDAGPVREFFASNAAYWIDEFHIDGLRLDATQQIFDASEDNILAEITRRVRAAGQGRATYVVGENEPQEAKVVQPPEAGGYGLDALWNDDFHHSAMVALTGRNEAYYSDYLGMAMEFVAAAKYGFLYQGQRYKWQKKRRGSPALDLPAWAFITFIQNHDQVANSGHGLRAHRLTSPGRYKALTALLLLAPQTPMLFQGQEFAASAPFFYFADHKPDLAPLVFEGRKEFFRQFRSLALPEVQATIPDPADRDTFTRCKLDFGERETHAEIYRLHRDLLRLRREDPAFRPRHPRRMDGAVLSEQAFVLRFFGDTPDGDRLLVVNLGRDLHMDPAPEPLLAPPAGRAWGNLWSSDDLDYGGGGTAPLDTEENWRIPGEAAVVLSPRSAPSPSEAARKRGDHG